MNIHGIPGSIPGAVTPGEIGRPRVDPSRPERTDEGARQIRTPAQQPATPPQQAVSTAALGASASQPSLPATPPPGTDPELWSILSSEERVFFAKVGAMGPLTYGRLSSEMQSPPPIARGGRLNVKA